MIRLLEATGDEYDIALKETPTDALELIYDVLVAEARSREAQGRIEKGCANNEKTD